VSRPPTRRSCASGSAEAPRRVTWPALRACPVTGYARAVDTAPEVHRVQLLAAARLEVQEQLRAVRRAAAEHEVDDQRAPRAAVAEHLDLGAEVGVGHLAEQRCIGVGLCRERGQCLVEVARRGRLFGRRPRRHVERAGLDRLDQRRPHDGEVLEQLDRAALPGRGPVVELRAVDLAREVEEDPDFVLQRGRQFGPGQYHGVLRLDGRSGRISPAGYTSSGLQCQARRMASWSAGLVAFLKRAPERPLTRCLALGPRRVPHRSPIDDAQIGVGRSLRLRRRRPPVCCGRAHWCRRADRARRRGSRPGARRRAPPVWRSRTHRRSRQPARCRGCRRARARSATRWRAARAPT
jgi:hypothetical protein